MNVLVDIPDKIEVTAKTETEYDVLVSQVDPIEITVAPYAGTQGNTGPGVPPGGATGQHLSKVTGDDYDTQWVSAVGSAADKQILFSRLGNAVGDPLFVYDENLKALALGSPVFLPDNPLGISANIDSYLQTNIQNFNGGVNASSDYIATADDGTDDGIYADLGICNSGFVSESWDATEAHDTYVFGDGGNVVMGTLTVGKAVKFFVAQTDHECHPVDIIGEINVNGLNMTSGMKVSENGFNLTDLVTECSSASAQTAAFAAGSKIVIRTDLL